MHKIIGAELIDGNVVLAGELDSLVTILIEYRRGNDDLAGKTHQRLKALPAPPQRELLQGKVRGLLTKFAHDGYWPEPATPRERDVLAFVVDSSTPRRHDPHGGAATAWDRPTTPHSSSFSMRSMGRPDSACSSRSGLSIARSVFPCGARGGGARAPRIRSCWGRARGDWAPNPGDHGGGATPRVLGRQLPLPPPPPKPLLDPPPNRPSLNPPSNPPPPPPPPPGASGQQLLGGVVGVQNRGVAPPVPGTRFGLHSGGGFPGLRSGAVLQLHPPPPPTPSPFSWAGGPRCAADERWSTNMEQYPPPCANTGLSKHGDPVFPHFWSFF